MIIIDQVASGRARVADVLIWDRSSNQSLRVLDREEAHPGSGLPFGRPLGLRPGLHAKKERVVAVRAELIENKTTTHEPKGVDIVKSVTDRGSSTLWSVVGIKHNI
ncbi:hypothetical protein SDC9_212147 [bioreactor metagenome]|uniref:Uncharacterized protein n=1 Tax=bioreactor metagenome TaxID=1076179 RepID=A0A645JL31_9ZZZZ